jgi:flagellar basal-body rod protein FlgB
MDLSAVTNGVTSDMVMLALDAASIRHAAIASNIANVNTEGYQPLQVSFDEQLGLVRQQLLSGKDSAATERALQDLRSTMNFAPVAASPTATKVQLDEEIAKLVRNTVNYQALLTAQSKLLGLTRTAINEGRR